ncbi:MAG: NUDIX domain-containing protein [Candidatus Magasanikiibacteriota bacterium]
MKIPKDRKAPFGVFAKTVEYYPMVSVNIILKNEKDEFLWIKRKNNPTKGEWWVPGGRIFNGETIEAGAKAVLEKETGIKGEIFYISPQYFEEIFSTAEWSNEDRHFYPFSVENVHYIGTAIVMKIENSEAVKLDEQSVEYKWSKEILSDHPYLKNYFKACQEYL